MDAHQTICFKCVIDPFLGGVVKRNGRSMLCSFCLSKRMSVPLADVTAKVKSILDGYVYEGMFHRRWSSSGVYDAQQGQGIEHWVSEIFGCDNVSPVVDAVCDSLSEYHRGLNYVKSTFTPNDIGSQWGEFREGLMHGNRFFNDSAKAFLDWIFMGLDKYSASSDEHAVVRTLTPDDAPPIYRARTCMTPESVDEIMADPERNLAAPPKGRAGEGRMNAAGVPVFYGALSRKTCVAELRPPVGGTVVSGEFRLNKGVRVLDFGRFEIADLGPVPSFFDSKYFAKVGRQEFLKFLHDEITLPVLPGSERNYLTSQAIAEYLATHCKPRIDGVLFKSVQEEGGTNIVLFSHVACAATAMMWPYKGGMRLQGPKSSEEPCIDYVPGSLVHHAIRGVVYDDVVQTLPDYSAQVEAAVEN
ncbi:hypothetical protein PPUJ20066_10610 [Pseudomonas putida]|nr:hypothetical protein PPUJ20066_10610 [Pseudomonas putida]